MKVFVTGGCGYVGYSMLQHLLEDENVAEVILYDNLYLRNSNFFLGSKFPNTKKLSFVKGDILDNYSLERALVDADVVVHLAAMVSTPFSDRQVHSFDQVNNWGTASVISAIEKSNTVKKLIYLSSISVYGNTKGALVRESSLLSPKTVYGISKLNAEGHIKRLSQKIETFTFRSGNVFGYNPCIRLDAVINKLMFEAQYLGKIQIHGQGNQKRAFVSVKCIGKYLSKVVLGDEIDSGTYNLVNYNISINDIAKKISVFYPDLDIIYLDRHLEMRSISVESEYDINYKDCFNEIDFHLAELKRQFRF